MKSIVVRVQLVYLLQVIIRITDINDNAPVFTPARKDLSLSESSTLNHVFPLTPAYDPDSPRNGVTRYDLLGGGNTFTLQVHTNQDGTKDLRLTLSSLLDRELVDVYHLQVIIGWSQYNAKPCRLAY